MITKKAQNCIKNPEINPIEIGSAGRKNGKLNRHPEFISGSILRDTLT